MLRLIGFFVVTLIVLRVLRMVPVVGALFEVPILGFWGAAILVALGASRLAAWGVDRKRSLNLQRQLGNVDTPRNRGKLGTLLASQGRHRAALEPLQAAAEGEPDVCEWRYRLGVSRLATGDREGALAELEVAARMDEEHAYGQVLLRLAEAALAAGDAERSLEVLERFERNHGSNPEQAYRRALALKALGRRDEARASLARVPELARDAVGFQKREASAWVFRAWIARLAP